MKKLEYYPSREKWRLWNSYEEKWISPYALYYELKKEHEKITSVTMCDRTKQELYAKGIIIYG